VLATRLILPAPSFANEGGTVRQGCAVGVTIDLLAWFQHLLLTGADDAGIAWPAQVAPADVHVIELKAAGEGRVAAESLEAAGLRVLFDDRPMAAGAKFTDADLIGCPLRLTVSPRSLEAGGAELSFRRGGNPEIVPLESLATAVFARLNPLMSS
jgi:prolyl-tRNA synthetase